MWGGDEVRGVGGAMGKGVDLERASADLLELRDAEDEADRVQDVGLSTTVEARDSIELLVEALHHCALGIRLETINDDLLNVHGCTPILGRAAALPPTAPGSKIPPFAAHTHAASVPRALPASPPRLDR